MPSRSDSSLTAPTDGLPMFLVVVVPFLNERQLLAELLESLSEQSRRPDRLLLVDDGSSDGSEDVAEDFARRLPEATVLRRPPRSASRDRLASASEYAAFLWALEQVEQEWDVAGKLDADLRLPPNTLAELERHLEEDPSLGMVGTFLQESTPDGGMERLQIPEEHVHGATKFYRRDCWEDIAPMRPMLGWDSIDERRARRAGWRTRSIALPGGDPVHLRPRMSHDGLLRGYRRFGRCDYALGEPPALVLALAARYARRRPAVLGAAHYLLGYAHAAVRRQPRAAAEDREFVRREEWQKLMRRLRRRRTARA